MEAATERSVTRDAVERSAPEAAQARLYRSSIKKKETMRAVLELLPPLRGRSCLELGVTPSPSWLLRSRGGEWASAHFEAEHVESARRLLPGEEVRRIRDGKLPFPDATFDVVVGIHAIRHLEDDAGFMREIARVMTPDGRLLFTSTDGASNRIGYRIRRIYGFTVDTGGFGDARDGYLRPELVQLVRSAGLEVERIESYSRIFTELVENSLQYVYYRSVRRKEEPAEPAVGETTSNGDATANAWPAAADHFQSLGWKFRAYEALHPLLRGLSLLDRLIPFTEGYMFCVRARKPATSG